MMGLLSKLAGWRGYAAVALLSGISGVAMTTIVVGWRADARLASVELEHAQVLEQIAQATVGAAQAARAEEARRIAAMEKQRDIAQEQTQALERDVAAAADTAGRLRSELDAIRRRGSSCNAPAAGGGARQSSADPIGVLIDVLTGMESAGREVAEYADRLSVSGAACEAVHDGPRAYG